MTGGMMSALFVIFAHDRTQQTSLHIYFIHTFTTKQTIQNLRPISSPHQPSTFDFIFYNDD